jgi:phospholipid-binding lipoprotein MlaA
VIDVATEVGLTKHNEDFGQTLGYWGVGEGWYLVLPLLGPSDNRDLIGRVGDAATNVSFYLPGRDDVYVYSANGLNLINTYAGLLSTDRLIHEQFDPYLFVRTAYLQRRQNLVYDGNPPPEPAPKFDDPAFAAPAKK